MSAWGAPWVSRRKRGLRTWVIAILGRSPKTGAELMDEMEKMSAGWWRPSPGSVYPLLDELAQEGVTHRREDGRYELTSPAREHFGWPFGRSGPYTPEDAVRELGALVSYLEDLQRSDKSLFDSSRVAMRELAQRLDSLVK